MGSDTELAGTQLLQLSTPSDALQPRHRVPEAFVKAHNKFEFYWILNAGHSVSDSFLYIDVPLHDDIRCGNAIVFLFETFRLIIDVVKVCFYCHFVVCICVCVLLRDAKMNK